MAEGYKKINVNDITNDFVVISENRLLHFFIGELANTKETKYIEGKNNCNFVNTYKHVAVLYSKDGAPVEARELAELPNTSKFIESLTKIFNELKTQETIMTFFNLMTDIFYSKLLRCLTLDYCNTPKPIKR